MKPVDSSILSFSAFSIHYIIMRQPVGQLYPDLCRRSRRSPSFLFDSSPTDHEVRPSHQMIMNRRTSLIPESAKNNFISMIRPCPLSQSFISHSMSIKLISSFFLFISSSWSHDGLSFDTTHTWFDTSEVIISTSIWISIYSILNPPSMFRWHGERRISCSAGGCHSFIRWRLEGAVSFHHEEDEANTIKYLVLLYYLSSWW